VDWWQVILIILLFIIAGLVVGYLAGYLIVTRLLKKPFVVALPGQHSSTSSTRQAYKPDTSGFISRITQIFGKIRPEKEKQTNTAKQETPQITEATKEIPKTAAPEFPTEPVKEKDKKIIEQQTRELIQKEAEEARRARLVQEREKKKAEQIAREIAQREAEAARKARELEEKNRREAEQQARESAQKEIEAARKAQELEEKNRKEAEQRARETAQREAEATREARETGKEEAEKVTVGGEQVKIDTPGLLAEVENNRMLANEPWTGKLIPFQTYVWNTNPAELHTLPASLREDMAQAYSDIQLANSIVWLATELGRRSPSLDENYMKLCTNIAARLETIEPLLKQSINK
jgi:chemotaxis protein histidine kinase CheA